MLLAVFSRYKYTSLSEIMNDKFVYLYKLQKWAPPEKPQPTNVFTLSKEDSDGWGEWVSVLTSFFKQVNYTLSRELFFLFLSFAQFRDCLFLLIVLNDVNDFRFRVCFYRAYLGLWFWWEFKVFFYLEIY